MILIWNWNSKRYIISNIVKLVDGIKNQQKWVILNQ